MAQKAHPYPHPTCDDRQKVTLSFLFKITDSIFFLSYNDINNFCVPYSSSDIFSILELCMKQLSLSIDLRFLGIFFAIIF